MPETNDDFIELAVELVAAYVTNNNVPTADLPGLIASVHSSLSKLTGESEVPATAPLIPAVPIRKSVTPEAIICLEDGKSFKSLKRHLSSKFGLTPEQYRIKWGLPVDYPMVAPAYAEARSTLAKSLGLGQQRRKAPNKPKRAAKAA